MKHILYCLFVTFFCAATLAAQEIGTWKNYLAYFDHTAVAETPHQVFAVADGSLYAYSKEDNSIKLYDKQAGMNDNSVSLIGYNPNTKSLLIVYANANMDILSNDGITNLPYLKQNTTITNKGINHLFIHQQYAYLSTQFGIMVIDMNKKEIKDTYILSLNISSCCIREKTIYASTENGILYASTDDNLLDKSYWKNYTLPGTLLQPKLVSKIVLFSDMLVFFQSGKGVFYQTAAGELKPLYTNPNTQNIIVTGEKLACINPSDFVLFSDMATSDRITGNTIRDISSLKTDQYWIANGNQGIQQIQKEADGSYKANTSPLTINSPQRNSPYRILCKNNRLYIVAGGKQANGNHFGFPGIIMLYKEGKWNYIDRTPVASKFNIWPRDYVSVAVDPDDEDHMYIAAFGDGVVEFKNDEPVNFFNYKNSTLETSIAGNPSYHHVDGLAWDKQGNLWLTNAEVTQTLKVLDKQGNWHSFYCNGLDGQYTLNQVLVTSSNHKWINVPRVTPRIAVFDDNGTLDDSNDDHSVYFDLFADQDGKVVSTTGYYCMVEDHNGTIWVGTDKGPILFTNPDQALTHPDNFRCYRVKIETPGNPLDYLLDNVKVTTIAVDGSNRKWIGTADKGVYLVSESGDEIIEHFDTDNSPLPSNQLYSIAINPSNGEVFMGTAEGLVSYQSEAIEGKEDYSNVYAFPNPVRPGSNDYVTITGLMQDSNVKITDVNGNLLFQGKSLGGQLRWNCVTRNGQRVSTGIYLVLSSTPEGKESIVTKIAVIK